MSEDVNDLKIKILFFCSNKKELNSTTTYLVRRGWEAHTVTELKMLFKLIGIFSPDFIMMSVNVKSQKMHELPKKILQTFNIPVITFGELSDAKTLRYLREVQTKYVMPGKLSGPSVHRKIKAIWQEIFNYKEAPEIEKNISKGSDKKLAEPQACIIEKNDRVTTQSMYLVKGELNETDREVRDVDVEPKEENIEEENIEELIRLAKNARAVSRESTDNILTEEASTTEKKEDTGTAIKNAEETAQIKILRHLFEQCALAACEEVTDLAKDQPPAEFCKVWPVALSNKTGLLIISHNGDERRQSEFTHKFFKHLNKEIHERARQISYEDEIIVPLDGVDLSGSIFGEVMTKTMKSENSEVTIKFIEVNNLCEILNNDDIATADKTRINPFDLTPGRTQGANLYLHLPVNAKYFLYLKSTAILSEKQHGKLTTTNTALYVNKEDVKKYKEYVVRNKTISILRNDSKKKQPAA